jgi:arsenic resistance protein ArsH
MIELLNESKSERVFAMTLKDLLPHVQAEALDYPTLDKLDLPSGADHPPRILILYGSLRPQSFSRKLALEAERILKQFGAETRVFDPHDLPMLDSVPATHPKVQELRALSQWSEGQVWVSPERHGTITGVFKNQIDWLPLEDGSVRPTQGRTLAVMQVCGGSQSFNVVNTLRVLGRWMRMVTIPNQSSVAKAWQEFDEHGRMKPSSFYDRVVDVMEELFKFTLMVRDRSDYLASRYSERKGAAAAAMLAQAAGGAEGSVVPAASAAATSTPRPAPAHTACCSAAGACA